MPERIRVPASRAAARVLPLRPSADGEIVPARDRRLFVRAAATVVGFWWLATGLIVALQRVGAEATMAVACVVAAIAGGVLVWRSRRAATRTTARVAFTGSALLWAAHQASFYAGWLVGPVPPTTPAPPQRSFALAFEAVHATAYSDAVGVALLVGGALVVRRAAHATALHALLAFWTMHQLARLCLFAGVVNPATRFLPERLQYLTRYFGPNENSALLVCVAVGLALVTAWLVSAASRAPRTAAREGLAMLAVLSALATLEHVFLATAFTVPLWELFLWIRGG